MDSNGILSLLEQFDDDLDDLEESLEPILKNSISATTSKLPVLDKAKLYILITYAIESILFSYLRLNGINAREQPVFKELTRVRQYFDKIKALETPDTGKPAKLDKGAAARFIKAGLTGNNASDYKPGNTGTGGVIHENTRFSEGLKAIVNDQVDAPSSDLEDKTAGVGISPRKRKAIDLGAKSSMSYGGSDAGALKEKRKRPKREKQKNKNPGKDSRNLRRSDDSAASIEDCEGK